MKYSVKFNGVELNEYLYVLDGFTPYIGAEWSPKSLSPEGHRNGEDFLYQKYESRTIEMPFYIQGDIKEKYEALEKILNVSEPKQLIFESHPDRYYMAIPKGSLNFSQDFTDGEGKIEWYVPDGLAHSTTLKEFTAAAGEDGTLVANIVNNGTVDVPISYEITHTADNGYIGIVSDKGAMQYGFVDEADGETYEQSECLFTHNLIFNTADDVGGTDMMNPQYGTNGSLTMRTHAGKSYLGFGTEGTQKGNANGGLRTITLPADSEGVVGAKNFYCWFHMIMYAGLLGQTGEMCITWIADDGTPICGLNWYKTDMNGNTGVYQLRIYTNGEWRIWKTFTFQCTHIRFQNPWAWDWGYCDLRKEGAKLTFYYWGQYPSIVVPDIENKVCSKIQFTVKAWKGRTSVGNKFLNLLGLYKFYFHKLNVEKWKDNPNRYGANDTVRIDGDEAKIYVNGMNRQSDEVRGSTYFKASPGTTKVEISKSEWAEDIEAKAYIREAWL